MFHILKVCNIKMELTRVIRIVSKTMFLYDCIKIHIERSFAVIKRLCFYVLPFLCSILHWTNVPKWKWIPAHKTDDVKALEWNSHQESTIWCIGLPLAEESINILALHSVVLKARLYRVVSISLRDIATSKLILLQKRMPIYRFILHFYLQNLSALFIIISLLH